MRSIDLFGGAGGLAIGASAAGFYNAGVVESSASACATLMANAQAGLHPFSHWTVLQADVRGVEYQGIGPIDLLTGGPPCQPFSVGGLGRGNSDQRDLFGEAARAVRELRPQAFVFENVKGLAFGRFSSYLEYIRLRLAHPELMEISGEEWIEHLARLEDYEMSGAGDGLRYRVLHRVLDAADYGVPQRRERLFIVGFRSDLRVEWHFPPSTHSRAALLWSQRPKGEYWDRHLLPARNLLGLDEYVEVPALTSSLPWRTTRDAISDLPDPRSLAASTIRGHVLRNGARSYRGHSGSDLDKPAKTIKAGVHGTAGGENTLKLPDGTVRYFTVREAARLQTFPDEMTFPGSWTQVMKQIGNAVPPLLAEIVLSSVASKLKEAALPRQWKQRASV